MRPWIPLLAFGLCSPLLQAQEGDGVADETGIVITDSGVDRLAIGVHGRGRAELRNPALPVTGLGSADIWLVRLGAFLDVQVNEYFGGYVEYHERFGAGGTFTGDGLQQAYLYLDKILDNYGVQVGRFELGYGSGRMVDPQEWLQGPFTFDGALAHGQTGPVDWDVWYTQAVIGQGGITSDTNFQGAYVTLDLFEGLLVEGYALRRRDFNVLIDDWTFGGRVEGEVMDGLAWDAEVALQSGDRGILEASGDAFAASLEYAFEGGHFFGLEWMYASGDDTLIDNQDDTFRPVFMDAHRFNGIADIVIYSNINDIAFRYRFEWAERWSAHADVHYLTLPSSVDGVKTGLGGVGIISTGLDDVGFEIDAYLVGEITQNLIFQVGGAYFFAGNAIFNNDDLLWIYGQIGFRF